LREIERHPDRFRVVALAANSRGAELAAQARAYGARLAVLANAGPAPSVPGVSVRTGPEALLEAAAHPDADVVLNAVVGAAGLGATLAALAAGKRLALANKESLVAGGVLVMAALRSGGGELIPVDSEHSAILQCLAGSGAGTADVRRVVLTASGGPFREWSAERLNGARPADALRHPTWDMGDKITVDSATLANKALEVIEAHFLYGLDYDAIEAVVHPQSVIHSFVELVDGSVLAQMGFPDMELPILYAFSHPARVADSGTRRFDPVAAGPLTFEAVDRARFPAFALGEQAGRSGGTAPAVYNAANEVAVAAFLQGRLEFTGVADVIRATLDMHDPRAADALESVLEADRWARATAADALEKQC
jgi:1-deoxy-D-xylulose-5-phosphate reductoisomerase